MEDAMTRFQAAMLQEKDDISNVKSKKTSDQRIAASRSLILSKTQSTLSSSRARAGAQKARLQIKTKAAKQREYFESEELLLQERREKFLIEKQLETQ